jgi:ribosomal protein S18 acetylase RimI-like enzyme
MDKISFVLRKAEETDYAAIEGLARQLYRVREEAHPTVYIVADAALIDENEWRKALKDKEHLILVADVEGQTGGFVHACIEKVPQSLREQKREFALIEMMAVSLDYRRSGIGRALVQATQQWASDHQLTEVELEVYDANKDAKGLYDALGFRSVKRRMSIAVD